MKTKPNTTHSNNGNGRRTVEPVKPAAFVPPVPEFKTAAIQFDDLPCVALIVPEKANLIETARIMGEVVRQLMVKMIVVSEAVGKQAQPEKILGPDEAAPVG